MNNEIYDCGGGEISPALSSLRRPSNMFARGNGVQGSGLPAFLTKTFTIVNDPSTNSIISWNLLGGSFIIWDHLQFSAEILPRYFKHSNFSSFVTQLNNYGFRKIGVQHQWEYENSNFQAGKEYLLTAIKGRNQNTGTVTRRLPKRKPHHNIDSNGVETRLEILGNEINESKMEMEKLKRQQAGMEFDIMALEAEVKNVENKSRRLIMYWAKTCGEIFAKKMREDTGKENSDDEAAHERKLNSDFDGNNNEQKMVKEDKIPSSQNQIAVDESGSQVRENHEANVKSEPSPTKESGDFAFWKKILLEDDGACENEAGKEMAYQQAKIALDLDGLITKLADQDNESVATTAV